MDIFLSFPAQNDNHALPHSLLIYGRAHLCLNKYYRQSESIFAATHLSCLTKQQFLYLIILLLLLHAIFCRPIFLLVLLVLPAPTLPYTFHQDYLGTKSPLCLPAQCRKANTGLCFAESDTTHPHYSILHHYY